MHEKEFFKLLSEELIVALGCTEPTAIVLAAAAAGKYVKSGEIDEIKVYTSANVIKNAMSVNIPGAGCSGMNLAAALGVLIGNPENMLEVLTCLSPEILEKAREIVNSGKVSVEIADSKEKLYIEVIIKTKESYAKAVIEKKHTNISLIEADRKLIKAKSGEDMEEGNRDVSFLNIESIWEFINNIELSKLRIIKQSIELNRAIGEEGLKNRYGLQVGRTILNQIRNGMLCDDVANYAMALTAAGSDARMAGSQHRVMSNSGSGNQGIAATLPVVAVWEKLHLDEGKLIRATALSHLITIYIKQNFGRLSALCGAVVAATGASCGIAYILGGGISEIKSAIQNMLGNVTGILCDGAKAGCALKVSTCTNAAVHAALMSLEGITIQPTDGIIEDSPENTIRNLCALGNEGTLEADRIILSIMLNKENCYSHPV